MYQVVEQLLQQAHMRLDALQQHHGGQKANAPSTPSQIAGSSTPTSRPGTPVRASAHDGTKHHTAEAQLLQASMQVLADTLSSVVILAARAPAMLPRVHEVVRRARACGVDGVVVERAEALERVLNDSAAMYVVGLKGEVAWPSLDLHICQNIVANHSCKNL